MHIISGNTIRSHPGHNHRDSHERSESGFGGSIVVGIFDLEPGAVKRGVQHATVLLVVGELSLKPIAIGIAVDAYEGRNQVKAQAKTEKEPSIPCPCISSRIHIPSYMFP